MDCGEKLTRGQWRFVEHVAERLVRRGGSGFMHGAVGEDVYVYTSEYGRVVRHQVNAKGEVVGRQSFAR